MKRSRTKAGAAEPFTLADVRAAVAQLQKNSDQAERDAEAYRHELTPDGYLPVPAGTVPRPLPKGAVGWLHEAFAIEEHPDGRDVDPDKVMDAFVNPKAKNDE